LERICRYVSRSAVANERLSLTAQGKVPYALKSAQPGDVDCMVR
jgi:hypothetical protein